MPGPHALVCKIPPSFIAIEQIPMKFYGAGLAIICPGGVTRCSLLALT
jgi:hypothetical protein